MKDPFMQTSVEDINSVQRRVKVDLNADLVNAAFDNAYRDLQKRANIRGFRQGKAPLQMIKKMYGESVAADVADKLIRKHLFEAIEKNELRPVASPALESVDLPKQGTSYTFSAVVDVMPPLNLKSYKGLSVVCHKRDVTEQTISNEIETLRKRHAKKKALDAGGKAEDGVLVTMSHQATIDGSPFAPLSVENVTVELGAGQSMKEIEDAVKGMGALDSKTISFPLSPEFPDATLAGKTANIVITVKELEQLVLPTVDDEFAKDLGFKDLEDCKTQIRTGLEEQANQMRKSELENNLMEQLIATNDFDVPPAMVAAVIDDMIEQMQWRNDAEKKQAKADQDFRKSLIDSAKKRAKNTLLLWEIAKIEDIKVGDEDIDQHFRKMLRLDKDPENAESQKLLERLKTTVGQNYLDNLKIEKTVARLLEYSKVDEHDHAAEDHHLHHP